MSSRVALLTTPQALYLATPEGRPRAVELSLGETVTARVISASADRAVVEIKGLSIAAQTTTPLAEGESVALEVASITESRIVLRIAPGEAPPLRPASDADILAAIVKVGVAPSRENLQAAKALLRFGLELTESNLRLTLGESANARALALSLGLPITNGVVDALAELVSETPISEIAAESEIETPPPTPGTPEAASELRSLLTRLLGPLEKAIAQGRTDELRSDPRSRLLAEVRAEDSPESALARNIEGMGVFNATRWGDAAEQVLYFQIPIRWGESTKTLELRVSRETESADPDADSSIGFRLSVETERLGVLLVSGQIAGREVRCAFETESEQAASAIARAQPDLQKTLEVAGFRLQSMSSRMAKDLKSFPRLLTETTQMARVDVLT
jgi:hypothetical protein